MQERKVTATIKTIRFEVVNKPIKVVANKTGDEYIYRKTGDKCEIVSVHYGKYK